VLEEALIDDLPDVEILVEDPESSIPRTRNQAVLRRLSPDRKRVVTLYTGALTIELADYACYADLKKLTETTLAAFDQVSGLLRCIRVGLRYINEVKSKLVHGPDGEWQLRKSWNPYINNDLLGGVEQEPAKLCAYANRGTSYFHSRDGDEYVSLDFGIQPDGLVDPTGVLELEGESGPCFILDIDASKHISPEESPANAELLHILDSLHDVVETIFQWSITDRTREIFRAAVQTDPDKSSLSASNS
jgi:uncharacterized protein (TIGR04255 family)